MDGGVKISGLWWPADCKPTAPAHALRHVADSRFAIAKAADFTKVAIQAGGNVGLWPLEMSEYFDAVHTFEPEPDTFRFLEANTQHVPNIQRYPLALGAEAGRCAIKRRSLGAHRVVDGDAVAVVTLDDMFPADVFPVGLIQLDVEGYELPILQGAMRLLAAHRPVLQLELRDLGGKYGWEEKDLWRFLGQFGYRHQRSVGPDSVFWGGKR
jgi:FkbM family methyltransferase